MKTDATLLSPGELAEAREAIDGILAEMDRQLLGRSGLHRLVLAGVLSQGHILLEGLPGMGKTALIATLGKLLHLEFKRVQFTPDLMPGDILGNHILQQKPDGSREMEFQPGPVFTNILLADEINRASPKTQSALLETMQERSATLLGITHRLPRPFFVLASQNPIELEGTYPLPEAQLDRFLFKINVPNVSEDVLAEIVSCRRRGEPPDPARTLSRPELDMLLATMERIHLSPVVARYIARLVSATHPDSGIADEKVAAYVEYGASPRAAIGIGEAARAWALMNGRPTVGFEDVRAVAAAVLNHRVLLNFKARYDKMTPQKVVEAIVEAVPATDLELPAAVRLGE
jgi:MoxR-like ATPase